MNERHIGKKQGKTRILLAPLDWGLGHASRLIPIIRELLSRGSEPLIAASGATAMLLQREFPGIQFVELEGYGIRYGKKSAGLLPMLKQVPSIFRSIRREHQWLLDHASQLEIEAIISDNRYGLWHPELPSIFLTHQLFIRSPLGKLSEKLLQQKNYRYISRFSECWVPDVEDESSSLAGLLSHPIRKPGIPIRYLGPLSRFTNSSKSNGNEHILIILSGPEPQRSVLENLVLQQLPSVKEKIIVVRGLPGNIGLIPSFDNHQFFNHLSSTELERLLKMAALVISRSGYSTVMDLAVLKKKSVLVPTPGQTEQEYLAARASETGFACSMTQKKFSIEGAIELAGNYPYRIPPDLPSQVPQAITALLHQVETRTAT